MDPRSSHWRSMLNLTVFRQELRVFLTGFPPIRSNVLLVKIEENVLHIRAEKSSSTLGFGVWTGGGGGTSMVVLAVAASVSQVLSPPVDILL